MAEGHALLSLTPKREGPRQSSRASHRGARLDRKLQTPGLSLRRASLQTPGRSPLKLREMEELGTIP